MTTAPEWQSGVGDAWAAEWRRTDRSFTGLAPHLDAAIRAHVPTTGRAADVGCDDVRHDPSSLSIAARMGDAPASARSLCWRKRANNSRPVS